MNKFREKLLDWKKRLSDRHMYSVVIVLIAVVAIWGIYQYKHSADLRQELDNQYNRAFYELAGYVENVDVLLLKSLMTATPEMTAETLQEAWHQANMAQTNLGQLPVSQNVLANTSKFLSQVGDLAYTLDSQSVQGKMLSDEQYQTIQNLHRFATELNDNLNALQASLSEGRLQWNELANKGTSLFQKASENLPAQMFQDMDNSFQEFPTLIYDGPFSDHMTQIQPKGLTGDNVTAQQAQDNLMNFIGADKVDSITPSGESNSDTMKIYNFQVKFKDRPEDEIATADVTQKGGHIVWMLYNRNIGEKTIDVDKAKELGRQFLESKGYENMKDTYYLKEDSTALINYAYTQDGVVVYPDLVKVKIALDNGEVVGFESKGYLMSHTVRDIPSPTVSESDARKNVSSKAQIQSSGLALIPTDYGSEIFVYEFKGKLEDQDFLVYINALTGKEEDILIIIDSEKGILTL